MPGLSMSMSVREHRWYTEAVAARKKSEMPDFQGWVQLFLHILVLH